MRHSRSMHSIVAHSIDFVVFNPLPGVVGGADCLTRHIQNEIWGAATEGGAYVANPKNGQSQGIHICLLPWRRKSWCHHNKGASDWVDGTFDRTQRIAFFSWLFLTAVAQITKLSYCYRALSEAIRPVELLGASGHKSVPINSSLVAFGSSCTVVDLFLLSKQPNAVCVTNTGSRSYDWRYVLWTTEVHCSPKSQSDWLFVAFDW